jgi:hypothetical protein
LSDLRKKTNWQTSQLDPPHRKILINTLLALYDATARRHILDMPAWTYSPFFELMKDDGLRRFAGENYFCAQSLLEWVETDSGHAFLLTNEYPLARVVIGLYGGVLEAMLAEKLASKGRQTLGNLINEAYAQGHLVPGTRLCALATILLYFRNHIHANREVNRTEYFIDLHVAKGLKAAIDLVIAELLAPPTASP